MIIYDIWYVEVWRVSPHKCKQCRGCNVSLPKIQSGNFAIDLQFKKAFQIKTYISMSMHEDTITTVVIVVMVIQIWRIKSKFWVHLDSCVNNGTWLSFSPIWITPILSTGPFERLHSKVKQITSPRPDLQENLIFLIIFRPKPEMPTRFSDESVHFCLLIPDKNILADSCFKYSRLMRSWGQCLSLIHELWRLFIEEVHNYYTFLFERSCILG